MRLIAGHTGDGIGGIGSTIQSFSPEDIGELRVFLNYTVPSDDVNTIHDLIIENDAVLIAPIIQEANILFIRFINAQESIPVIACVLDSDILFPDGIAGWQLYIGRESLPTWIWVTAGIAAVIFISGGEIYDQRKK
jgi:hypothetical protein